MNGRPQDAMTVGLIHFMAYPEVMAGEGPVVETVQAICDDDYFGAIEVTTIRDANARKRAVEIVRQAGLKVAFGAQPILLRSKLNLNASDPAARRRAVDAIRGFLDEAKEWNACALAVLSGVDPGEQQRNYEKGFLIASLKELCEYSRRTHSPAVLLETFDRVSYGKNCLIGPTAEASDLAAHVMTYCPSFGLVLDLSHLPLLDETPDVALKTAARSLKHVHIGNCVKRHPSHAAYGDNHPAFGIPEGENGVEELAEFLRALIEIGYVGPGQDRIVSFEVKPFGGQSSAEVIANAKQTLDAAWAAL